MGTNRKKLKRQKTVELKRCKKQSSIIHEVSPEGSLAVIYGGRKSGPSFQLDGRPSINILSCPVLDKGESIA